MLLSEVYDNSNDAEGLSVAVALGLKSRFLFILYCFYPVRSISLFLLIRMNKRYTERYTFKISKYSSDEVHDFQHYAHTTMVKAPYTPVQDPSLL